MARSKIHWTSAAFGAFMLIVASTAGVGQTPLEGSFSVGSDVQTLFNGQPQRPQLGAAGDMIGFSSSDGAGTQTITLVHTSKSWMAVYHIDKSGKIRLVSSRPVDADFSLQLNATSPLPEEIRQLGRR